MVRYGLRNLFRNKPRLAVTAVLLALPFFLLLVMQTIGAAVQAQTVHLKSAVDNTLQVRARGSMGHVNMTGNDTILPPRALDQVRGLAHVARVEPYLLAMTPTQGQNFAMVVGVNPGDTKRLESHGEAGSPKIIAGRDLTPEDRGRGVAIIGQGYARFAGIAAENLDRATLTLDLTRTHPVIFALKRPPATLKIVGIYASGYVFGDMQLFLPLDTFREIYGVPQGISWLFIQADSSEHVGEVERALRAALGDVADIIAPTSAAEFEATATRSVMRLSLGGTVLAAILMALIVFFVMLFIARERAREIGTLKAIGASNRGVGAGFLAEAIGFCLAGAAIGVSVFALWGDAIVQRLFGLGVTPFLPAQYRDALLNALTVTADLNLETLGLVLAAGVAAAVAGSAYGIRHVIKLSPIEAMRHE